MQTLQLKNCGINCGIMLPKKGKINCQSWLLLQHRDMVYQKIRQRERYTTVNLQSCQSVKVEVAAVEPSLI